MENGLTISAFGIAEPLIVCSAKTAYTPREMQALIALLKAFRFVFIFPILLYQYLISPLLPASCIYKPTCSAYSKQAILKHGVLRGGILAVTRIFRCAGGLFTGGDDPVPEEFSFRYISSSWSKFRRRRKNSGSRPEKPGPPEG
jgi:hypothetical protein